MARHLGAIVEELSEIFPTSSAVGGVGFGFGGEVSKEESTPTNPNGCYPSSMVRAGAFQIFASAAMTVSCVLGHGARSQIVSAVILIVPVGVVDNAGLPPGGHFPDDPMDQEYLAIDPDLPIAGRLNGLSRPNLVVLRVVAFVAEHRPWPLHLVAENVSLRVVIEQLAESTKRRQFSGNHCLFSEVGIGQGRTSVPALMRPAA